MKMLKNILKERRKALRLKQSEVAEKIGVTTQTYMKWENGIYEPKISYVTKIAKVLKVSEKEICKGELNKSEEYNLEDFLDDFSVYQKIIGEWKVIKIMYDNIEDIEEFKKDLLEEAGEIDEEIKRKILHKKPI
ncbi:helix-turn-helix transcriptional regulator [Salmonella enterica]|nr:helix-turn-helix transcriptional regulator [Salmonella enterica subsp. enterica serovar Infantis]EDW6857286.1 helix-turn-helix transcriptional regulator [Salmonella enterica]EEJ5736439.1 helix-turn-helix transcriptional regulator [Salmonella enterica]